MSTDITLQIRPNYSDLHGVDRKTLRWAVKILLQTIAVLRQEFLEVQEVRVQISCVESCLQLVHSAADPHAQNRAVGRLRSGAHETLSVTCSDLSLMPRSGCRLSLPHVLKTAPGPAGQPPDRIVVGFCGGCPPFEPSRAISFKFNGSESKEHCMRVRVCVCVTDRRSQRDHRTLRDDRVQRDADGAAEALRIFFMSMMHELRLTGQRQRRGKDAKAGSPEVGLGWHCELG